MNLTFVLILISIIYLSEKKVDTKILIGLSLGGLALIACSSRKEGLGTCSGTGTAASDDYAAAVSSCRALEDAFTDETCLGKTDSETLTCNVLKSQAWCTPFTWKRADDTDGGCTWKPEISDDTCPTKVTQTDCESATDNINGPLCVWTNTSDETGSPAIPCPTDTTETECNNVDGCTWSSSGTQGTNGSNPSPTPTDTTETECNNVDGCTWSSSGTQGTNGSNPSPTPSHSISSSDCGFYEESISPSQVSPGDDACETDWTMVGGSIGLGIILVGGIAFAVLRKKKLSR